MRYALPLSKAMGKIRIKERLAFSDYGMPQAPTKTIISPKHYIEWQIGYDRVAEKEEKHHFIGANGKKKCIYELSAFLAFGLKNALISKDELLFLRKNMQKNTELIDKTAHITRTHFVPNTINGIAFLTSSVSYPLLVYKCGDSNMLCEIIVREKQFAVGIMPMLYVCIALSALYDSNDKSFIGRMIKSNECGYLRLDSSNMAIFMQIFNIFGMLSEAHKHDCLAILDYLINLV